MKLISLLLLFLFAFCRLNAQIKSAIAARITLPDNIRDGGCRYGIVVSFINLSNEKIYVPDVKNMLLVDRHLGAVIVKRNAQEMAGYLTGHKTKLFDYAKYMDPFRAQLQSHAEGLAKKNGLKIIFIRSSNARKGDIVKKNIDENKTGLVCLLSTMEACPSYQPWHNKITHKSFLKGTKAKCLHFYFYFNDPDLVLGYVRVPTWAPFQLLDYFNGHNRLARLLKRKKIGFSMIDNALDYIENFSKAQKISDQLDIGKIHKKLGWFAGLYCPVYKTFDTGYHWSVMQLQYSTDIVFKDQAILQAIYPELVTTAIHAVKPDHVSTFLGQKLNGNYNGEIGNNYHVRVEGSCIKHSMRGISIKIYDKFSKVLPIETTVNNISQCKHYRTVELWDGTTSQKEASARKNIYSLEPHGEILKSSNHRYIEFILAIEDHTVGKERLNKIAYPKVENDRKYKGFNFFEKTDLKILQVILRDEFNINGFRSKDLKKWMADESPSQLSRILKRLRVPGLIKKFRHSYKYYVTVQGKIAIATGLKLKNIVIIPHLNYMSA